MLHTARRLKWVDQEFEMCVFTDDNFNQAHDEMVVNLQRELSNADILVIVGVTNEICQVDSGQQPKHPKHNHL
ncbi:hypothetical protein LWI29_012663 [Acer saccharum]|uniref:Uncharacterized protein n=1 Tax=Acer saccharum TaxID=4024 RepID=A0AA39RDE7_ACESA|nr:hypothetical protein LWI29_012663 [Acer saccharum]